MMVLIDKKFWNFFPKMHIERDIRKKIIATGLKPPLKKGPGGGAGI